MYRPNCSNGMLLYFGALSRARFGRSWLCRMRPIYLMKLYDACSAVLEGLSCGLRADQHLLMHA